MSTASGTGHEQEETDLGMRLRIIAETETMVLVGVPLSKEWVNEHLPFIASVIEAAQRLFRRK